MPSQYPSHSSRGLFFVSADKKRAAISLCKAHPVLLAATLGPNLFTAFSDAERAKGDILSKKDFQSLLEGHGASSLAPLFSYQAPTVAQELVSRTDKATGISVHLPRPPPTTKP